VAADSAPRRILKRVLAPILTDRTYQLIQSVAMAWDIRSGAMSEPEIDLIRYAVREGDTAIDIGANYGLYSYHLSRAVAANGRVYAFEPIPFTAGAFRLIARLLSFRNVELIEKGCGEAAGEVAFTVPVQESGAIIAGTVHMGARNNDRPGHERHARFTRTKKVTCQVVTVDDYLGNLKDVSFLKCDIEGADLYALRGAKRLIEQHHPIVVCEINPWFLEGFGIRVEDIVGFFAERGYGLFRYEQGRLRARSAADVVEDNWVFVHPDRQIRVAPLLA
jgi:FkbM family methyltransferase